MSELPKGWAVATFDDVIHSITNGLNGKQNKDGNGIPVSRIESIASQVVDMSRVGYLDKYDEETLEKYRLQQGDVLFSHINSPAHIGKTAICEDGIVLYHGVNLLRIVLSGAIEPQLFNYYCKFIRARGDFSSNAQHAVNQSSLNQKKIKSFEIVLPPKQEQIHIANKLDSILAKVDKAQARLDKIPTLLKRFRQSVLAAATSGELTKEWREAEGISKYTWQPVTIDDLSNRAFDGPFGSKLKTADYTDHGIKVARLENIGHLVFNSAKETFISEVKYQDLIKNTIEHNDILFSSFVDEEIRTCLFDERFGTYINKADCFCIRPNQEVVSPEFLMYSLACKHTYAKIKKQVHGATRPRVNLRFLKSFEISLPSPEEQIVVVDKINQLFGKASKVEKQYLDAKARLDRLTQSILAKAFRGELVPQDPTDEPAEKLLERILAERGLETPKKKTTKKRTTKAKTAEKG